MSQHVDRHHKEKFQSTTTPPGTAQDKRLVKGQSTLPYGRPLAPASARAKEITRSIAVFMAKDMRPFSVVENDGFKQMVKTLEPLYSIPGLTYFAEKVVPALYMETKEKVMMLLKELDSTSITTDGWTLRAAQSYITITAHGINSDWKMVNCVLQTRAMFESHTGHNIAEVLTAAVNEWDLKRANRDIAIVTDNARNMDVAVKEAGGLAPHIKCFAHTLNLATQAGLKVTAVSRLLGRVRRVAAFFHRSTHACGVFKAKQKALGLAGNKLIVDCRNAMEQQSGYA